MTIEEGLEHKNDVRILFSEYTDMLVSMDPGFRIYLDIVEPQITPYARIGAECGEN